MVFILSIACIIKISKFLTAVMTIQSSHICALKDAGLKRVLHGLVLQIQHTVHIEYTFLLAGIWTIKGQTII